MRSYVWASVLAVSSSILLAAACGGDDGPSGTAAEGDAGAAGAPPSKEDGGSPSVSGGKGGSAGTGASQAGEAPASGGAASATGGSPSDDAGSGPVSGTEISDGPSEQCLAALAAFEPCGGTLTDGTYLVTDVSCSDYTTVDHGPGCGSAGSMRVWYEGPHGDISISNDGQSISFNVAGALMHVAGVSPAECAKAGPTDCGLAYFDAPENPHGDCKVEGESCHCSWYTESSNKSGGGSFTTDGSVLTTGGAIPWHLPYCLDGDTLEIDVSDAFAGAPKPLLLTAVKQP